VNTPPLRTALFQLAFLLLLLNPGVAGATEAGTEVVPPEAIRSLVAVAGGTGDLATRTTAMRRLGEVGQLDSIVHILRISLRDPKIRRPSWAAATGILKRHNEPTDYLEVYKLFNLVPPETRIRLASCVADADSIYGARLLSDILGPDPELDQALLSGLHRMTGVTEEPSIMAKLRCVLNSDHDYLRRDAAHVMGSFKDYESIPDLIALLRDDNRAVREGAYWSLRNISGLSMPANAARWSYWYQQETEWWERKADEAAADLSSENPARIMAAIQALAQRSLHRDQVEGLLRSVSEHEFESVRWAVESALVAIGAEPDRTLGGTCGLGGGAAVEMVETASTLRPDRSIPAPAKEIVEPSESGSSWLLWLGGAFLSLALFTRVLGMWSADQFHSLTRWWNRP